jgi:formate dehydrogenase subunit gamma
VSIHAPWNDERAAEIVREHSTVPGAMLPVLHALHAEFGYVDKTAIPLIAGELNVSEAEVVGVLYFYKDFRDTPPGRHTLRVCRAEACQAMGADALVRHIEAITGTALGGTSPDREFTVEAVYCLGNCALSPAVLLDGRLHGRVTPDRASKLLSDARTSA